MAIDQLLLDPEVSERLEKQWRGSQVFKWNSDQLVTLLDEMSLSVLLYFFICENFDTNYLGGLPGLSRHLPTRYLLKKMSKA